MQHTTNYNLPQWEATDAVKREDVNGAMSAVDTALKSAADTANGAAAAAANAAEAVCGVYGGTGATSQAISLGRRPRFVLVESRYAVREINSGIYGAMALDGHPSRFNNTNILEITDDGFTVYNQKIDDNPRYAVLNSVNMDYYYLAIF